MTSRYSFAKRPVWILGHALALAAVIGFLALGFWQLRRHDERRRFDDRVAERIEAAHIPLEDLLAGLEDGTEEIEYRQTTVTGTYVTSEEVILEARTLDGRSGHEVLTPLLVGPGIAVIVDRGWVPIDVVGPPVVGAEPPPQPVTLSGYVRLAQVRRGLGPVDPPQGELDRISRVDVARLGLQTTAELLPVWIQLAAQSPEQSGAFPAVLDPPRPGGGPPHISYAVQWFAFAGVVLIAYPVLLRRTAVRGSRRRGSGVRVSQAPPRQPRR